MFDNTDNTLHFVFHSNADIPYSSIEIGIQFIQRIEALVNRNFRDRET